MNRGKIWINVPDNFDIHIITDGLVQNNFIYCRSFVDSHDEESAVRACEGCVGIISGMEPWNEHTLSAVKDHIKMIIRYGTGYNNIDVAAATRYGIAIFNAAGRNAPAVAEIALLHMLNAGRKFTTGIEMAKHSKWGLPDIDCFELDHKTIGLYGAGAIARNLARMLSGFEVKILAYDLVENDAIKKYGVTFVKTPEELFETCDIISIHIPLMPATKGIVNKHFFSLMKTSAILINTSRGSLINEADLLEVLQENKIRAAGLDVLCEEPMKKNNPLICQKNAYVTTHIAASTYEAKVRVEECLYQTIADFFDEESKTVFLDNYINHPILKG